MKKPFSTEHEYADRIKATRHAINTFMRWNIIAEARASIALDNDAECHSCSNECNELPQYRTEDINE